MTESKAEAPLLLVQVMPKVFAEFNDPVKKELEVGRNPTQSLVPPEALQDVALLEFQRIVVEPPKFTKV